MKYHYTYKTTNLTNGKYYLGKHSTKDLDDGYLGSGSLLMKDIKEQGKENFKIEILEFFDSSKEALSAEEKLITEDHIKDENCYNIVTGGTGGIGKRHTEETRQKLSEALRDNRKVYKFTKSGWFIKCYDNYREAAEYMGLDWKKAGTILLAANPDNKKYRSAYGYMWSFSRNLKKPTYKNVDTKYQARERFLNSMKKREKKKIKQQRPNKEQLDQDYLVKLFEELTSKDKKTIKEQESKENLYKRLGYW